MSAEGIPVSVYYADVNNLELGSFDCVYKRLSFNSTLCQLEFRIRIKVIFSSSKLVKHDVEEKSNV